MRTLKKRTPTTDAPEPRRSPQEPQELPRGSLRRFRLNEGLPNIAVLQEELQDYTDVLLGRVEPPVKLRDRTLALMECSDAYFARASEIKMLIHGLEREGKVLRGTALYQFRTGELATFMEMSKRAADLGSRRLTEESNTIEAESRGREYK